MTSSESKEPKGSERSSTNRCCRCGQPVEWIDYAGDPGWSHSRGATTRCTRPKPDLHCECGALWSQHAGGKGSCYGEDCECMQFRCDHTRCGWKPREEAHDFSSPAHCAACMKTWIGRGVAAMEAEPPLTPEEEEEAAPEVAVDDFGQPTRECYACDRVGCSGCAPPQPERRPPYAVAYSVQGHLFEVALSGDATVRAVDGALVIQHHLGPVAGIVSVLPVINKESNAQADH